MPESRMVCPTIAVSAENPDRQRSNPSTATGGAQRHLIVGDQRPPDEGRDTENPKRGRADLGASDREPLPTRPDQAALLSREGSYVLE